MPTSACVRRRPPRLVTRHVGTPPRLLQRHWASLGRTSEVSRVCCAAPRSVPALARAAAARRAETPSQRVYFAPFPLLAVFRARKVPRRESNAAARVDNLSAATPHVGRAAREDVPAESSSRAPPPLGWCGASCHPATSSSARFETSWTRKRSLSHERQAVCPSASYESRNAWQRARVGLEPLRTSGHQPRRTRREDDGPPSARVASLSRALCAL